jgi:thymidylate synthase
MALETEQVGPASGPKAALEVREISTENKNGDSTTTISKNHEEYQYLNLIRDILAEGEHRPDRYGEFM